jgi:hypothetical protein
LAPGICSLFNIVSSRSCTVEILFDCRLNFGYPLSLASSLTDINVGAIRNFLYYQLSSLILLSFSARRRTALHNFYKYFIFQFLFRIILKLLHFPSSLVERGWGEVIQFAMISPDLPPPLLPPGNQQLPMQ